MTRQRVRGDGLVRSLETRTMVSGAVRVARRRKVLCPDCIQESNVFSLDSFSVLGTSIASAELRLHLTRISFPSVRSDSRHTRLSCQEDFA